MKKLDIINKGNSAFCLIFVCIFLLQNISLYKNCTLIIYMVSLNMLSESIMRSIKPLADSTCHLECGSCGLHQASPGYVPQPSTGLLPTQEYTGIPVCKAALNMGKSFSQSASRSAQDVHLWIHKYFNISESILLIIQTSTKC